MSYRFVRRFRTRVLLSAFSLGLFVIVALYCIHFFPNGKHDYVTYNGQRFSFWPTRSTCKRAEYTPPKADVDTGEFYPKLDFNYSENRQFWNRELEARYRKTKETWKDVPLEVILLPHSHVDPGWLRTFDNYYDNSVSHILDNMVSFLNKQKDFKFIWSEVSYFAKWWERQNQKVQDTVKEFIKQNQLEMVTGGWVMTDEATTHYFSIIDQLIEGHQWLDHFIGVKPNSAWSVDVFGHSATLPYILSTANIMDMTILRIHYAWKAFFAKFRYMDFYWQQQFASSEVLCHMAPSDLYSFKHTCGPDPVACLKFDFRRIGGEYSESSAVSITDANVEFLADYLLSQYGRYASLFPHNVLLVPLGDDFRYNVHAEWVQQYENYHKLIGYINDRKDWNARIRFGTLTDYFSLVKERIKNSNISKLLPTVQGDFLPYADIYADVYPSYWTGYYTTRPFYKKLSQQLEYWLRTAEILYSLSKTIVSDRAMEMLIEDYAALCSARQNLALFQHHDAITGTSKALVMEDYGHRLHSAILDTMVITSHAAQFLMMKDPDKGNPWTSRVYPDIRLGSKGPAQKVLITIPQTGREVILFNSLTNRRSSVVRLHVNSPHVKVIDRNGEVVLSQINPTWDDNFIIMSDTFELVFVVNLKPLSLSTYTLLPLSTDESKFATKTTVSVFLNDDPMDELKIPIFNFEKPTDGDINLYSQSTSATFSSSGYLKEMYLREDGIKIPINVDFSAYLPMEYKSGGYLFRPKYKNPIPIQNFSKNFPLIRVIRGLLVSELTLIYHPFLSFSIRLYNFENAPKGAEISVTYDITKVSPETELIMHVNSDVENDGVFYTDSNGFQMLKRIYVPKLHVQGNYYPSTTAMYIEDEFIRMNVLVPYSHGVTSPTSGTIEIMLDRTMSNDDLRGLGEGIEDNQLMSDTFWLLPERKLTTNHGSPTLSNVANLISDYMLHPITILVAENIKEIKKSEISFLPTAWAPNMHLVNLRTIPSTKDYRLPSNNSLMIINKKLTSCVTADVALNLSLLHVQIKSIKRTFLTGTLPYSHRRENDATSLLQSYEITF